MAIVTTFQQAGPTLSLKRRHFYIKEKHFITNCLRKEPMDETCFYLLLQDRNVLHASDAILVHQLNLECWQVDQETLLDLVDALLQKVHCFLLAHV